MKRIITWWRVPNDPNGLHNPQDLPNNNQSNIIMKHIAFLFTLTLPAILLVACATGPAFDGRVSPQSRPMTPTEIHKNLEVVDHTLITLNTLLDTVGRFR